MINIAAVVAAVAILAAQDGEKLKQLPPGKHALLERFTAEFGLSFDQQLQIEPLLHNEESVSKPLLAFSPFSAEEKQAMMLKVKLAARGQIRTLLTPDQQKKMDGEYRRRLPHFHPNDAFPKPGP